MRFNKILLYCIICIFTSYSAEGQTKIRGRVTDANTNQPIGYSNVFVPNSMLGTLTDEEGNFILDNATDGTIELVISHLSYETQVLKIANQTKPLSIQLKPKNFTISEINITGQKQKKWKRYLRRFEKAFFGETRNAIGCKILNPEVLYFETQKDKALIAKATDLLLIENKATGYKLSFYLEKFEKKGDRITYSGKPFFQAIPSSNPKQKAVWKQRRLETYNGSSTHFFRSLINKELKKEGFEIYLASLKNQSEFVTLQRAKLKNILRNATSPEIKTLIITDFLKVIYLNEKDLITHKQNQSGRMPNNQLGRPAEKELMLQQSKDPLSTDKPQISYLFGRKSLIPIDTFGFLHRPKLLVEYGYWSWERIADLLPREYHPTKKQKTQVAKTLQVSNTPTMNGFTLSKLIVPLDEIHSGGPPKDGIPSIDQPRFTMVKEADYLSDEDMILGINLHDKARAYPIRILNYHEVVNDQIGNQPFAITYCPLCGSGLAFETQLNGKKTSLGVSGLLYNSDVLLYDRLTESLWSQIMGRSIAGSQSGNILEAIPIIQTSWKDWKTRHPHTEVLSDQTGFKIDYTKTPYEGYTSSDKLLFPVARKSDQLMSKETIIGVEINGKFKAYPFSVLEKSSGKLTDYFMGETLIINYDSQAKSARISTPDNNLVQASTMYWFAWYAFHPETDIYQL